MSLITQTPRSLVKRCLQAQSFQSARAVTQHWSSVFPECRQPPQPFIGQTTFATSMSLVKPTPHPLVKRCLQALSFQSVRVVTQHFSSVFPECRQQPYALIGRTTLATSISLVKPTSHSWVKRCLQALSLQSVDNHRNHSLVKRRLQPA